jgi:hypothetical protein
VWIDLTSVTGQVRGRLKDGKRVGEPRRCSFPFVDMCRCRVKDPSFSTHTHSHTRTSHFSTTSESNILFKCLSPSAYSFQYAPPPSVFQRYASSRSITFLFTVVIVV